MGRLLRFESELKKFVTKEDLNNVISEFEKKQKDEKYANIELKNAIGNVIGRIGTLLAFICLISGSMLLGPAGVFLFLNVVKFATATASLYFLVHILNSAIEKTKKEKKSIAPIYVFFTPLFLANVLIAMSSFITTPILPIVASSLMLAFFAMNILRLIKEEVDKKKSGKEINTKELVSNVIYSCLNICIISMVISSFFVLSVLPIQIALIPMIIIVLAFEIKDAINMYNKVSEIEERIVTVKDIEKYDLHGLESEEVYINDRDDAVVNEKKASKDREYVQGQSANGLDADTLSKKITKPIVIKELVSQSKNMGNSKNSDSTKSGIAHN